MRCVAASKTSTGVVLALTLTLGLAATARADFWFDERVKTRFSNDAGHISDGLLRMVSIMPITLLLAGGPDDETAIRLAIYGESMVVTWALNRGVKEFVGRPRPYTYSYDPLVRAYVADTDDPELSFYSGHTSQAFAAAVTGSLLYRSDDKWARASVWFIEIGLAASTGDLRTISGKHFYSDVLFAALAGTAIGIAVPWVYDRATMPTGHEWAAIGGGLLMGVLLTERVPYATGLHFAGNTIAPTVVADGAGFAVSGSF